jgi:hypothetical protein
MEKVKKKGADNVIPVNAMTLIGTDTSAAHETTNTSPDFREGSS